MSTPAKAMLLRELERMAVMCSPEQADRLVRFGEILLQWNKTYNLTALRSADAVLTHHLLDSASLVPAIVRWAPEATRVLDVGSGGGLPSIPLAILRPDLVVEAVDTVKKKATFLTQAAIDLRLTNFRAHHARVEKLNRPGFDVVTSRAFASLSDFTSLSASLLKPGGLWLAMKGMKPDEELAELPAGVKVLAVESLYVPALEDEKRHVVVMTPQSSLGD